jgi:hypothetical protein
VNFLGGISKAKAGIGALVAGFGALIILLGNLDKAHDGYCNYIGILCSYEVDSPEVSRKVSPGNPCNNDYASVCVEPSTKYRRLVVSSMKFVPTSRNGNLYNDGNPDRVSQSETGWYRGPKDESSEKKMCVTAYARTGGCEDKYFMTGHIKVFEKLTVW